MASPQPERNLMYLSFEQWSPRFDETFFSFKITSKAMLSSPPPDEPTNGKIDGKTNHPAWYYTVQVHSEHRNHTVSRRYSQFRWLYDELRAHPPANQMDYGVSDQPPISMPPKTCPFQFQTEEFAQTRLEELSEFLKDALQRPGNASHPAVAHFLELNRFEVKAEETLS